MIKRIIKLTQNEVYKLIKQKFTYLSIICLVIVVVFSRIGISYLLIENTNIGSGYLFLLISSRAAISMVGVILILIFSSMLISSESSSGTLQMILINPLSRLEFFFAKIIIAMIFAVLLIVVTLLAAFIIGKINFNYGDYKESGIIIFTQWQIFLNFLYCYLLLLLPIFSICCYSLLISILTNNVGLAIGSSVGSILILDIVKEKLKLSPFLFQSYLDTPFEFAQNIIEGFRINWAPKIFYCIGVSGVWAFFFIIVGYFILSRKDYKY